jgi:excisionase family DNA binding protein
MHTKTVDQDERIEQAATAAKFDPEVVASLFVDGTKAARMLLVSRTHIYKLMDRGVITAHKIGSLTVFWKPELEEAIEARRRAYEAGKDWTGK